MLDKLIELYHATKSCREGSCYSCNRKKNLKSTYTYPCKCKLLEDCNNMFSELIDEFENR